MSGACNCLHPSTGGCAACRPSYFYPITGNATPIAPTQRGWECPKCGGVMAPWMPYCARCPSVTVMTTQAGLTPEATQAPKGALT